MKQDKPAPLIVIAGPTASGKTALAVELASKFNGEIICADSRSIYKGLDIGTAKPTEYEQRIVPHWGLDLVEPNERFTAADFKRYAEQKISEIRARGHVPFLVGGTGLYIDAVIFDYQFGGKANEKLRQKLQQMTIEQLREYCMQHGISLPENDKNKRYIIRNIERNGEVAKKSTRPIDNCIIVGISTERDVLRTRIILRSEQLFDNGVIDEARVLGENYGWGSEAMKSNIYPLARMYFEDKISLDEMKQKFVTLDWRLAKRQLTWLKRNEHINWLSLNEAKIFLMNKLATNK